MAKTANRSARLAATKGDGRAVERAYKAYRNLVYETPGFTDYFFAATPIAEIAELNLGSRPASRKSTRRIEDLRAIPWGFSWGQCRLLLPGWYGFGAAVSGWLADGNRRRTPGAAAGDGRQWPFFATLLSNMDMVLAKTDLPIASRYAELVPDVALRERIFKRIAAEYGETLRCLEQVTGNKRTPGRQPAAGALDPEPLCLPRSAESLAGGADPAAPGAVARSGAGGSAGASGDSFVDQWGGGRVAEYRLMVDGFHPGDQALALGRCDHAPARKLVVAFQLLVDVVAQVVLAVGPPAFRQS
jgi:hypothetical protein